MNEQIASFGGEPKESKGTLYGMAMSFVSVYSHEGERYAVLGGEPNENGERYTYQLPFSMIDFGDSNPDDILPEPVLTEEEKKEIADRKEAYEARVEAERRIEAEENLAYIREVRAFLEAYKANPEGYPLLTPRVLEALTDWRADYDKAIEYAVYTDDDELYDTQYRENDELDRLIIQLINDSREESAD